MQILFSFFSSMCKICTYSLFGSDVALSFFVLHFVVIA